MEFMRDRSWAEAARTWRQLLDEASPPALWMQFGHALKELGHFREAGKAYRRAFQNDSFDSLIQMAHYEKSIGKFEDAQKYYRLGLERAETQAQRDEVRRFLSPLERILRSNVQRSNASLFISCVVPSFVDEVANGQKRELGRAHYSYSFAARGFCRAADELEIDWQAITNPQYIADARVFTTAETPIHLGFYPPSEARLMKGAYNILCFAWEFSRLKTAAEVTDPHAFADYRHMLNVFDEVWAPSRYAAGILAKEISKPVFFVPSPVVASKPRKRPGRRGGQRDKEDALDRLGHVEWVPLSTFSPLQGNFDNHAMSRRRGTLGILDGIGVRRPSKVFLSVFNPQDRRKQIKPLLEGFLRLLAHEPEAVLLLKTSSPDDTNATINRRLLNHQIADERELALPCVSDRVWITNATLSDEEMSDLYRVASFYVCTSYAEGQNLPVLEAMSHGVVPVSVDHTAMSDYIDNSNSVIIRSELRLAPPIIQKTYGMYGLEVYFVDVDNVLASLVRSATMTAEEYGGKSRLAIKAVANGYGPHVFERALSELKSRMNERAASHV
jgi:glycosyltransferase involved in cell wall biosynthesis